MIIPQPPAQSELNDQNGKAKSVWSQWFSRIQTVLTSLTGSGPTSNRPTSDLFIGQPFFDTTINKPIWWNGSVWIDATGATV